MGKFDSFKVNLKGTQPDVQERDFFLDNQFFANVGSEDIQKGKINVHTTISKTGGLFTFEFVLKGNVVIPCDRCLDDMEYPIEKQARLIVKFGKDYSEESDEIVVIPESESIINLAWFLYEFVALDIPLKHVHAPGKCNKQMTGKLKAHSPKTEEDDFFDPNEDDNLVITDKDDAEAKKTDPRWDDLKNIR